MNIDHLDEFELQLELSIRKVTGSTFIEKYNNLRILMEQEEGGDPPPTELHQRAQQNPQSELTLCILKLKIIRDSIRDQLTSKLADPLYNVEKPVMDMMKSKLLHTLGRLQRLSNLTDFSSKTSKLISCVENIRGILQSPNKDFNELNQNIKLLDELELDRIEDHYLSGASSGTMESDEPPNFIDHNPPQLSTFTGFQSQASPNTIIANNPISLANLPNTHLYASPEPSTFLCQSRNRIIPSMHQNLSQHFVPGTTSSQIDQTNTVPPKNTTPNIVKRVSVAPNHKPKGSLAREVRNLRFTGAIEDIDIDDFLYRFESLSVDFGIPVTDYVEEFHGLLEGAALGFYWVCRRNNRFIVWEQLRQAFRERFQNYCSDNVIRLTLENRRQKPNESFLQFYNDLLNTTHRLRNPLSQNELFFLLTKNMSALLQVELAPCMPTTIADMVQRCVNIESTWERLKLNSSDVRSRKFVNEVQTAPLAQSFDQYMSSLQNSTSNMRPVSPVDALHAQNSNPNVEAIYAQNLKCWNCEGPHR